MNTADLIWLNGEFVAWEDAKVHVLTHGLHYGTGVFEGIRAYETERGHGDLPPPRPPRRASRQSAKLYYMDLPFSQGAAARGHPRADRPQRLQELLHPPARLPRLRPDGPQPARQPGRGDDRRLGVGRLPGRGRQEQRRPRAGVLLAAHLVGLAHPALQGRPASTSTRCSPRSSRIKAGYDEAILLDDEGNVCEGTGENVFVVRDGVISTPPQTAAILDGINRESAIQIARDLGYEVVERDIARAELTLADEVFLTGTAAELTPVREIDDIAIGDRPITPGPSHATRSTARPVRGLADLCGPRAAPVRGLARPACRPSARTPTALTGFRPRSRVKALLYDTTLRDGMQGEGMSLSVDEKLRVAHALDSLGVHLIEAGFPGSNPKEEEFFELLARRELRERRDRGLRDDAPPGRRRPRTTPRCGCWPRCFAPGLHARRQDVVAAPGEGHAGASREENLRDDRRLVAFLVAQGKRVIYDAEHFFDGYRDDPDYALELPARPPPRRRRERDAVRHQRRHAAGEVAAATARGGGRARRRARSASTPTTTPAARWPTRSSRSRPAHASSRAR